MSMERFCQEIRTHALRMVHRANASHIGSALGIVEILGVLYGPGGLLRVDPSQPDAPNRDRFILSKGHACVALYAALAQRGYFALEELNTYGTDTTRLMAHASHRVPGVELSTGSLGHGLPVGCGLALAAKRMKQGYRTWVLLSDGEMDEGSNWEGILFAAHHCLDNLTILIDANGIQSLGPVETTLNLEPLVQKLEAFGWNCCEVDGHNTEALREALLTRHAQADGRPVALVARTVKGRGVSFMERQVAWHYKAPNAQQLELALQEVAEGLRHA